MKEILETIPSGDGTPADRAGATVPEQAMLNLHRRLGSCPAEMAWASAETRARPHHLTHQVPPSISTLRRHPCIDEIAEDWDDGFQPATDHDDPSLASRRVASTRDCRDNPHVPRFAGPTVDLCRYGAGKWLDRPATARQRRRGELDAEVGKMFTASKRTYGSPRIHADLLEAGWAVSVNTVADSMRKQGLQGRKPKHSKGLTRQDKRAPKFPDLVDRDFTAPAPNVKWCGDMTEIPTDEGKLYLATVLGLFSRRLLACPTAEHPNAELACDAIKIAAAVRGGRTAIDGVIVHTDRGSTYTATSFTMLCKDNLGVRQSMGRVGFDNAAAESFFASLKNEMYYRYTFATRTRARFAVADYIEVFYNRRRLHSTLGYRTPFEALTEYRTAAIAA